MKPQIVKWPRVEDDLLELASFIARDKLEPALRLLSVAEESFERLAQRPGIGLMWKSRRPQLRGVRHYPMPAPYRSYTIFYRETTGGIEIIAILHGARHLEKALNAIE